MMLLRVILVVLIIPVSWEIAEDALSQVDGENPRLWISRSEDYFDMYGVEGHMWVKVASMHFTDSAARWLQSVKRHTRTLSWPDFCKLVMDRFGHDQHELLIRQLIQIKQTSTVTEYV